MLLARLYEIGTLFSVPVMSFGYIEEIGFGEDSLLETRKLSVRGSGPAADTKPRSEDPASIVRKRMVSILYCWGEEKLGVESR